MLYVKVHKSYRDVVAICDADLLGKHFEEDDRQINVKHSFYEGDKKTPEEALKIIKDLAREDSTFNIVGKKAIELALQAGIISKDGIKEIQGIPFALVLM